MIIYFFPSFMLKLFKIIPLEFRKNDKVLRNLYTLIHINSKIIYIVV